MGDVSVVSILEVKVQLPLEPELELHGVTGDTPWELFDDRSDELGDKNFGRGTFL